MRVRLNGFVLAGGKSSRMGRNKALMQLGKKPLVLRAAETLRPFAERVALLAPPNQYENLWPFVVADKWPNRGPLAAICTGLLCSDAEWNIFLACDLPFIDHRFMEFLVRRVGMTTSEAVVPYAGGGWQPLAAAYRTRCRNLFLPAIEQGEHSIVTLIGKMNVDTITEGELLQAGLSAEEFANVNAPEDWERIERLLAKIGERS